MDNTEAIKLMRLAKQAVRRRESSDEGYNDIIAELSKEASLNPEEVARVVEWTNTIKMLNLYKSGNDKTTEFEVADPKKINRLIHKEASVQLDDFDYIVSKKSLEKLASCTKAKTKPKENYKRDRAPIIKKAYAKLKSVQNKLEESKMLSYREKDKFLTKMAELAHNLNKHYSETFSDFEVNARSILGDPCLQYLNVLEKMANNNNLRSLNFEPKNVTKSTENFSLLKEAMTASKLHHFYKHTTKSFSELHKDFTAKVEGTLR